MKCKILKRLIEVEAEASRVFKLVLEHKATKKEHEFYNLKAQILWKIYTQA